MKLVDKYLGGKATAEEEELLHEYYTRLSAMDKTALTSEEEEDLRKLLWHRIQAGITRQPARLVPMKTVPWWRYVAAAVVVLLVGFGGYLALNQQKEAPPVANGNRPAAVPVPGGNKAVLTLADGTVIALDDAKEGSLAQQGNTQIIKLDGKLTYTETGKAGAAVLYNTLSTPRGGQYQVTLPDGSAVWLNAESSLRFPAQFSGDERRVSVTGEAYFEVAKNAAQPFLVEVGSATVKVLGTHFNINGYADEGSIKTTLLEGAVEVNSADRRTVLRPGQQARLQPNGDVALANAVDVDNVIAWKNGQFQFENADIETVGRQLSRWYDVEVAYNRKITERFYFEMPRSSSLRDVLKVLELAGNLKFKLEGKNLVVL